MTPEEIKAEIAKLSEKVNTKDEKERLLEMAGKANGPDKVVSAEEYLRESQEEEVSYLAYTQIPTIDRWVQGFRPGTLNVISGLTKQGKTTFCQTLTVNFTNQGLPCLWFSLDTPPIELIGRFLKLPNFYLPKSNFVEKKLKWIELKIMEGIKNFGIKIVFIDNLEFLTIHEQSKDNYANQLGSVIIQLKEIAIKWDVIIFLNHHVRAIEEGKKPSWYDLKDSSGIAHHSDTVFMIYRLRDKSTGLWRDESKVSLELQRRGGRNGVVTLKHKDNLFYEEQPDANQSERTVEL